MPNPTGNLAQEGHINARLCFWVRAEAKEPQHTHTNDHVIKVQSFFFYYSLNNIGESHATKCAVVFFQGHLH